MKYLILTLFIAITMIASCGGTPETVTPTTTEDSMNEVVKNGITFKWKVTNDNLLVEVTAPTTGWVSVGFDPDNMMNGANFIIGYVDGTNTMIRDDYGDGLTSHAADISDSGTSDVTIISGTESNSTTILEWMIPMDSGDGPHDSVLTEGNTHVILLAYGSSDSFTSMHVVRLSFTTEL